MFVCSSGLVWYDVLDRGLLVPADATTGFRLFLLVCVQVGYIFEGPFIINPVTNRSLDKNEWVIITTWTDASKD